LQDHAAPRTHSNLLFKGAVKDTAKSVYTGLIRIRENATSQKHFKRIAT
jgi:Fe-S cluster assembly scaffold protein SufB